MTKHAHPTTQFDPAGSMKGRPFERALLVNRWFHAFAHLVARTTFTAMVWPRFVAPFHWELTRHAMPIAELPPAFEGYKLLHLTDLHLGRTRTDYVCEVVDACMQLRPDLVVVTGDLIHYEARSLAELSPVLGRLSAPDGVVTIFGNHDYHEYSFKHTGKRSAHRAIHKRLVRAVESAGLRLLRNQHVTIERGGSGAGRLHIVGLDELWTGNHNPGQAFSRVPAGEAVICLQHNPDGLPALKDYPWRWMLCGHSHGGQIDLPLLGPLYVPQEHREWLRGMYRFPDQRGGEKVMFVSRGVGHSAPLRFRVRPEATLFTLTRAVP